MSQGPLRSIVASTLAALCLAPLSAQDAFRSDFADLCDPDQQAAAVERLCSAEPADVATPAARALLHWLGEVEATENEELMVGARGAVQVLRQVGRGQRPAFRVLAGAVTDPYCTRTTVQHVAPLLASLGAKAGRARLDLLEQLSSLPGQRERLRRVGRTAWVQLWSSLIVDADLGAEQLAESFAGQNPHAMLITCDEFAARAMEVTNPAERDRTAAALVAFLERSWNPGFFIWVSHGERGWWSRSPELVRRLRTRASLALRQYRPEHPLAFLGACQELFEARELAVRQRAARSLGRLRNPDAVRWLIEAAAAGPEKLSLVCLRAIERIGPAARFERWRLTSIPVERDSDLARMVERVVRTTGDGDLLLPIEPSFELVGAARFELEERVVDASRRRLLAWLDANDGSNRACLVEDVRCINDFSRPTDRVRWVPVRVVPDELRPGRWASGNQGAFPFVVDGSPKDAIGPDRERLRMFPWVVELIAVDRRLPAFDESDLRGALLRPWGDLDMVARLTDPQHKRQLSELCDAVVRLHHDTLLCLVDGLVVASTCFNDWAAPVHDVWFRRRYGTDDRVAMMEQMFVR